MSMLQLIGHISKLQFMNLSRVHLTEHMSRLQFMGHNNKSLEMEVSCLL